MTGHGVQDGPTCQLDRLGGALGRTCNKAAERVATDMPRREPLLLCEQHARRFMVPSTRLAD
jgi:hypothetical protein